MISGWLVARLCDRVVVLYGGRIMEEGPAETMLSAPDHPYSRGLLAATPRMEAEMPPRLVTIPGTPRSGGAMLPGCPFAPRCTERIAECDGCSRRLCRMAPGGWPAIVTGCSHDPGA